MRFLIAPLTLVAARPASAQLSPGEPLHVHEPFVVLPARLHLALPDLPWLSVAAGLMLLGVLAVSTMRRAAKERHKARIEVLGIGRGHAFMLLDVLCHAIRKGGAVHPARLERALLIARDMTDIDYTEDHLREAAANADRFVTPMSFWWMRPALSEADRQRLFQTTLAVLLEAGPLTHADRTFLRTLTRAIGMRHAETGDLGWLLPA